MGFDQKETNGGIMAGIAGLKDPSIRGTIGSMIGLRMGEE